MCIAVKHAVKYCKIQLKCGKLLRRIKCSKTQLELKYTCKILCLAHRNIVKSVVIYIYISGDRDVFDQIAIDWMRNVMENVTIKWTQIQ